MDEAQSDKRGIEPIEPMLAEIDKLRTPADVGRMIARLHAIAVPVPFGVFAHLGSARPRPT